MGSSPSPSQPDVYLASASPRRRELLEQIGVSYQTLPVNEPEAQHPGEAPEAMAMRLALAKAWAGWAALPPDARRPVLGADTVVVVDEAVLGKPRDRDEGLAMLARLSGCAHQVLTAVALVDRGEATRLSRSVVTFRPIRPGEAAAYWASGEPRDKAGGYAIQGRGAVFVARLEGSYSGVMGLPLFETAELLAAAGINILGETQ